VTTVEIGWDSGSMGAHCKAFAQMLKAADAIAAGRRRAGRVLRTEPMQPSR
jgi:hypothetical protein